MSDQMPTTVATCDGCGEELNLLRTYLYMMVKPQREVLVSEEAPSEDPNEPGEANIYLGTKSGAGEMLRLHADPECVVKWAEKHDNYKMKYHTEDEIYVPEDNPDDDEIARREDEESKRIAAAEAERAAIEGGS